MRLVIFEPLRKWLRPGWRKKLITRLHSCPSGAGMAVFRKTIGLKTDVGEISDITSDVQDIVLESGIASGIASVFVPGSTAAITTIEFEDGALTDLSRAIERLAPKRESYAHDKKWDDGNGFSHVRAALLGPGISVPVAQKRLELGTWQQIVFMECDNKGRAREIIVTVVGD